MAETGVLVNDDDYAGEDDRLIEGEQERDEILRPLETRNVLRWCSVLLLTVLLAMEAMGYQALLPALLKSGQFQWLCSGDARTAPPSQKQAQCDAQQHRLDLMFTLGYVGLNLIAFPLGVLMHRYPPKYIACSVFLAKAGAYALLAASTDGASAWLGDEKWQNMALVAYAMVASLGLAASLPFLNLPPILFPTKYAGLANSSLMGAADASTVMYFIVREIYLETSIPLRAIFLAYSGLAIVGSVASFHLLSPLRSAAAEARKQSKTGSVDPVVPRLFTRKFTSILLWHCAFFVSKYFYMTNITEEARWLTGSDDKAYDLNTTFSILMPATGILTPLVGFLLSKGVKVSLVANASLAALLMVCSCVKWLPLQYAMLFCVAASRFMVFSIVPTLCSLPEVFGAEGSVFFSLATGVAGVLSTGNYGLSVLASKHDSYLAINICFGGVCLLVTVILLKYLADSGIK